MWLHVYISKAGFSLQLLPGAQAGMMRLQGKLREASNPTAGGIRLERRQLQILHPRPLIAMALRSLPLPPCCPRFRCSASVLFLLLPAGLPHENWPLRGPTPGPRPSSPHLPALPTYPYPCTEHCKLFSTMWNINDFRWHLLDRTLMSRYVCNGEVSGTGKVNENAHQNGKSSRLSPQHP